MVAVVGNDIEIKDFKGECGFLQRVDDAGRREVLVIAIFVGVGVCAAGPVDQPGGGGIDRRDGRIVETGPAVAELNRRRRGAGVVGDDRMDAGA